ncbi:sugar O-acetyltransferase [Endozoicomonas gorgoniicola]|uniref:Sugar O-acetyltransferase n=1 Tax=Endozoicomonas gorgoniicola TaxID=1234144 RepID=A0ABT3MPE0_9GAMM|nr:sugar O-acetyltransferase [Endozoicomonas gorgoniicola]MCW7551245.1 sugar O-acetyltransferase [Endozoicomonas gorgoniicola]
MLNGQFSCDYGYNIEVGKNFYMNFNGVILDCGKVVIGDNVMIGPNVTLCTAGHPLDIKTRNTGEEFAKPVTIGNNVWIGANVLVLPGVTLHDGAVVGGGSVVTKDVPADCVVVGSPARVVRKEINLQSSM